MANTSIITGNDEGSNAGEISSTALTLQLLILNYMETR